LAGWLGDLTAAHEERAQLALLETAEELSGSGAWAWELSSDQFFWSPNMYRILGLDPEAAKPSLQNTVSRTHPGDRARVEDALAGARKGAELEICYRILTQAGTVKLLHAIVAGRISGDRGLILVGWLQDLTEARVADAEIAAHIAVATALAEWDQAEQPAQRLLRALGLALGFSLGILWVPGDGELRPHALWSVDEPPAAALSIRLGPGQGLAGRAWERAEPISIVSASTDPDYRFREAASRIGLHGALAIPVISAGEVLAIVGLSGTDELQLTERLKASLTGIGYEIGAHLAGRAAELGDPTLTGRELEVLRMAADGLSGPAIARRLAISPGTVKTHFEHIYAKYGVPDRVAAVAKALRQGLIQ
jgi:DNA-binding NarL/FixJ family response regulator